MSEMYSPIPAAYPEEVYLQSESMVASASIQETSTPNPELARTHGALNAQESLYAGNASSWHDLTRTQRDTQRLTPETYAELYWLSHDAMPDAESYEAVRYINTVHDICKNPEIMLALGLQPSKISHDEGLRQLFLPQHEAIRHQYLPSYDNPAMFTDYQREIIEGVLTAPFNFIRFVQSQASEYEITSLESMPRHILLAAIVHGIHDLGGAMGHKDERASLTLDEPAAVRLLDAAYALTGNTADFQLPNEAIITPQMRQRTYMTLRAARLGITATDNSWTTNTELVAQLTVADLLRSYTAEDFATPQAAFNRLHPLQRAAWSNIHALPIYFPDNLVRFEGQGTEYAPAFLRALGQDEESLYVTLSYFAQIHHITNALPILEAAQAQTNLPTESPYRVVNFYHLANWFANNGSHIMSRQPILVHFGTDGDTITPEVLPEGGRSILPYDYLLMHPDVLHPREAL